VPGQHHLYHSPAKTYVKSLAVNSSVWHVNGNRPSADPLALAIEWVSKITTVALEMVLPAIGGRYLDQRLSTQYWALIGLVLGFSVGMWHLLQMTKVDRRDDGGKKGGEGDGSGN
jgi:hypothetical protein